MSNESIYQFKVKTIDGKDTTLEPYKGKYMLIVNVASNCGFTPQYKGLQALYDKLKDKLVVLGFPCNQFGEQEPGAEKEIQSFCELNFGVNFPMFGKIDVNGTHTHPLYAYLKKNEKGFLGTEGIKWNFTKFLVDPNGEIVKRYAPTATPETIEKDVTELMSR